MSEPHHLSPMSSEHRNLSSPPTSPTSDGEYSEYSSTSSSLRGPPYTPEELGAIFLDFYTFLTTLHYDPAELKVPPPGGWPGITPELCAHFKSNFAIEVLRHLPYFDSRCREFVHYKSKLIDYTSFTRENFEEARARDEDEEITDYDGNPMDMAHVFRIANGRESGGRLLFLNVRDGLLTEDWIRCDGLGPMDVNEYFGRLKESYRRLQVIPCPGRTTLVEPNMDDRGDKITKEQVCAQTEKWCTELDVQYIKQVYRHYGWPDAFRRDKSTAAIDELMSSMVEQREAWEKPFPEWLSEPWNY